MISIQKHSSVFPPVRAPKAHGLMTAPTANSQILMPTNIAESGLWTRGVLIRRNVATVFSHSSPHGARSGRASRRSFPLKAAAGRSRTASRRPRTRSGSITTKAGHGMAGIARLPRPCSLLDEVIPIPRQ